MCCSGIDGTSFFRCQVSKAFFWRDLKISFLGGQILFCREPLAMDVKGADEKVKVPPSTQKWEEGAVVVLDSVCCCIGYHRYM